MKRLQKIKNFYKIATFGYFCRYISERKDKNPKGRVRGKEEEGDYRGYY